MKEIKILPKVKVEYINMSHWGNIYLLPTLYINVVYSQPTITFIWWIFRFDFVIYRRFPGWFMKYIWSTLNFDFSWTKKENGNEEDEG